MVDGQVELQRPHQVHRSLDQPPLDQHRSDVCPQSGSDDQSKCRAQLAMPHALGNLSNHLDHIEDPRLDDVGLVMYAVLESASQ